ncbi:MAG: ATP-binding protein [bacterium]|nr:ATP-binding protein [bacterium]
MSEADFHLLDVGNPIQIEVTVGNLPDRLITVGKFGMYLRGWKQETSELIDEPDDETEAVLTIRFTVDDSFEPSWVIMNDRTPEGKPLSMRDRELMGVVRITSDVNRHLTWTRGSALSGATESGEGGRRALALAQQSARHQVEKAELSHLGEAAGKAEVAARKIGAIVRNKFRPSLYLPHWGSQYGVLGLYDGEVPLHSAGLGTRRLVALGPQSLAISEGSIVLIDEIENGLEPHRLRHLLSSLRPKGTDGQVFFTTHSAVTLIELKAADVQYVMARDATTCVTVVADDLQPILRAMPEAFLAKRVVIAEGKTELGLTRGLEEVWQTENEGLPLTHRGSIVVDGAGGPQAKVRALKLAQLGTDTALLVDSDNPELVVDERWQRETGVKVFCWEGNVSTEERVALDLPWDSFTEMVLLAARCNGHESVCAKLSNAIGNGVRISTPDPNDWLKQGISDLNARHIFGITAKSEEWF